MKMHNLGTVFSFEVMRMLKKKSFWAMALGFPVLLGALVGIAIWSQSATEDAVKELEKETFQVAMVDDSGLVNADLAHSMKITTANSKDDGVQRVKHGDLDGFIYFPANIARQSVEVYGKDVGIFKNSRYGSLATVLLEQSAATKIDPSLLAVVQKKVNTQTVMYRDGAEYDAVRHMIAPGIFLVLFYMLVGFFSGQMLNSTIEEKENRTVEMLLTTVQSHTLIMGKILAMATLAIIQGLVILLPVIIMYITAGDKLSLPNIDLTNIIIDPMRICIALAIFAFGFLMITGLLVAIGATMPTAKEASSLMSVVFILLFAPLYGASVFVSYPDSPFVQFFSYFPFTSPIPLLLRNTIGNLQLHEALIAIAILIISTIFIIIIAVRLFRYGAMAYDSKISPLSVLRARRQAVK